jgi:hypothetical protein
LPILVFVLSPSSTNQAGSSTREGKRTTNAKGRQSMNEYMIQSPYHNRYETVHRLDRKNPSCALFLS